MTHDPPERQPAPAPKPRRRLKKRWALIVPLGLVAAVLFALQTPAAKWIVEPLLRSQTGMEVGTGSVRVSPVGNVTITHARFDAPGVPGLAGRVLSVERIRARIDWASTLRGSPGLKSLHLFGPELRLSQDVDTGVINAAAFKLFGGGGGGGPTPRVSIDRGAIELGEHRGADYTALRRWNVRGDVERPDPDGVAAFSFAAIPANAGAGGSPSGSLGLSGTIGPDGVTGRLDGLALEDWPASIVPTRVREIYARLALSGRLLPTEFAITGDGRVTVRMMLDGVDMYLPFNESYSLEGGGELLRMRQTRGTIAFGSDGLDASLSGLIDELRYDVTLDYRGLTADAPFDASLSTSFRMDDRFRPRRFLPEKAVEKLDMFESPAADVAAVVQVARAQEGGQVAITGRATLRNGRASYGEFRYPFANIRGSVSFTQNDLIIERVEGDGPTGATLLATGRFDGLDEQSTVRLDIAVRGVPIDDALMGALTSGRRQLVEALFNPDRYRELIDDGLIRTPGGEGPPDAPLLAFGGSADVDLILRRDPARPEDDRWTKETSVRLDRAGLVPEHFPLPIVAHGIEVRISDDQLALTGGRYEGLTGGEARVEASLDQTTARPGTDALPIVEIFAEGIPVDKRLLAAIPGYREPPDPAHPVSLRSILDNLRVEGKVECHALIGPRSDGSLGYDVEATLHHASARPAPWSLPGTPPAPEDPIALEDMSGTVYVTERLIVVDLNGQLLSPAKPLAPTPISLLTQLTLPERRGGLGDVERKGGLLPIQQGPPVPGPGLYADARADGLDLAMPIENAAAVVSPDLAERLSELRASRQPDGVVSLRAELDGIVGGHTETLLAVDRVNSFSFLHEGVRHRVGPSRGTMDLTLGVRPVAHFEGFRTPIVSGGEPAGDLSLDGDIALIGPGDAPESLPDATLHAVLKNARVQAPAINQAVRAFAGDGVGDWLRDRRVSAGFDMDVRLSPAPGGVPARPISDISYALPPLMARGVLHPRSLSMTLPSGEVAFDSIQGDVLFEGMGGRVDGVSASAPGVSLRVDGPWTFEPGHGAAVDLALTVGGDRLDDPVLTLLPEPVLAVLGRFEVKAEGPVQTDALRVVGTGLGTPDSELRVSGGVGVSAASAVVGVPITEMSGRVDFEAQITREGVGYAIDVAADRMRAGRLRVEDARATILAEAARPGVVLVPEIDGRVHGGRLAGTAQARTDADGTRYWVDLHASDVRAAPVFDDLLLPPEGLTGPPVPGQDQVLSAWSVADDYTRGVLDADVSASGVVGRPERTAGRGVVRAAGGSVIALPGLINLVEFSNLKPPVGSQLDGAEAVFYIDGTKIAFERLNASSKTIEILGYGTMDWLSRDLDLRFRSRAIRPIPLFSDIIESVRDELITTKITGRPGDLRFAAQSFSGTRRLIRALIGEPDDEQEQIMSAVERASRAGNNREEGAEPKPVLPSARPAAWADERD